MPVKAIWQRDRSGYTDNQHHFNDARLIERVEANANDLANQLGVSIKVCRDIRGCREVKDLYSRLMNGIHPVFDEYSDSIADHGFHLKADGQIIAAGWSPYIDSKHLSDADLTWFLERLMREYTQRMFPKFNESYELIVLGTDKTLYYPGRTVTFLFVKRGSCLI